MNADTPAKGAFRGSGRGGRVRLESLPGEDVVLPGADGVRLQATAWGDPHRPPVMLLHGGGQTRHAWRGTSQRLAEAGFRAMAIDLRGHGESEWSPDGRYSYAVLAADVAAVAAHLGRPPALVGASAGGFASMLAAAGRLAGQAWALVVADIVPRYEPEAAGRIVGFMRARPDGFASIEEAADAVARYMPHRPRPSDPAGLARNLRLGDDGRWRWHYDPRFVEEMAESRRRDGGAGIAGEAARLRVPTLLVRGRESDMVTVEGAREFLGLVPHAEFVDLEGAGHMVVGDRNDAFGEAALDFLLRHRPS